MKREKCRKEGEAEIGAVADKPERNRFGFSEVFSPLSQKMGMHQPNSIEDIFESSLHLEDTHYKEGYEEGYTNGLTSGKEEGRQVGLKTGFEDGEELGFYRGCIDIWKSAIEVDPNCFSSRVQKSINQMDDLLQKYPISDPENESVTDTKDSLRLKFKAICASLNMKLEYSGYPKASIGEKTEF